MADDFTEHQLSSESVFSGRLLDVRRDSVRLPDGNTATREYIVHPGAVMILPLLDDATLLIERQYRYAMRRHFYELPAGKLEPGEDPVHCGRRELLEETGYVANSWRHLITTHPCIAYSNERIDLYLARDLSFEGHPREDGEFLETLKMPIAQALAWIQRGQITDSKTVFALLWAEKIIRGEW